MQISVTNWAGSDVNPSSINAISRENPVMSRPCSAVEPFREPVHAFDDRHILRTCLIVLVAHGAVGGAAFGIGIPGRMGQMAGRHGEYGVSAMLY